MSEFGKLSQEVMDLWWRFSPVSATAVGVHDYDHLLDDLSRDYILSGLKEHKAMLSRLERIDASSLSREEVIDWDLLKDSLRSGIANLEVRRLWEKDPAGCVQVGLYGVFFLAVREFAPLEQRAEMMLARLKQVPRTIEQGKACLKDSPGIFSKVAVSVAEGGIDFYRSFVPAIADQVPKLKAELLDSARKALEAVDAYARFLKDEWLARSTGVFAVGREFFDFLLKVSHGLPYDADDLLKIGNDVLASTESALDELARKIEPGRPWWELVADLKRVHPKAPDLVEAYRREMQRARDFTREHGLVTIPEGEALELMWTPPFDRSTIPYAAYMSPAPFEKAQKGLFYVTPLNEQLPPERQEEQLRGHSSYGIPVTALHEAYPGHHLQLVVANHCGSSVRRVLGTSVFVEGWALYCEEMMYEKGFYTDPRSRLMQLKDQVWRGCRVLIDVGLHTQGMTYEQAVDLLVKRGRLERVNAEVEVNRYCLTPTQPMSYVLGKHQIMALRRDYEARRGAGFNLREFHDKLLSFGSIPVAIIRREMLAGVPGAAAKE